MGMMDGVSGAIASANTLPAPREGPLARLRKLLDGDPLAFSASSSLSPEVLARFRAEQLTDLARSTPVVMLASCFSAITFAATMWSSPLNAQAQIWAGFVFALGVFVYFRRVNASPKSSRAASPNGVWRVTANALLHGSLWGALPVFFFAETVIPQQFLITALLFATLFGGAYTLSLIPGALLVYVTPIFAGYAVAMSGPHDPVFDVIAGVTVFYTVAIVGVSFKRAAAAALRCASKTAAEEGALRDELTRMPNRVAFREELERAFARLSRRNERFALMCFDLDGFKGVNDTMGHKSGDAVLIEAARRLKASIRENDFVARLGGDEFALIAADIEGAEAASAVAQRILAAFRAPFDIAGGSVAMSASIGVAMAPSDGVEPDGLMRNADSAMYATKQSGRCGYTVFRDRFGFVSESRTLEAELERAFAERELFMVYQPFVDTQTQKTTGFEALLRWRHPIRGVLDAAEIVPLFERLGKIDKVGAWALREALSVAATWPERLRLAVNISTLQLRKPNFEQIVREALDQSGFAPERLELELTETALTGDGERAFEMLSGLRRCGVRLALDDLGTGHSSLAVLVGLPVDRLKVDPSFVANLETHPMSASVVKLTLELARSLSLAVTAEGVEKPRQLEILRQLGCPEVQGHLFSRPRQADEIAALFGLCPVADGEGFTPLAMFSAG